MKKQLRKPNKKTKKTIEKNELAKAFSIEL
jgi:hypothetical protein